jgi:hypothetical protein
MIDACFSGGLTDPRSFEYLTPVELARRSLGILYGSDDKNGGIFMSCRSNQKSHEDEEKQHGTYTYELLRGWRDGEARNRNGIVTLTSLRGYLEESFANYQEQAPKANLFGSKSIELWYGESRAPSTPIQRDKPLPKPRSLTDVGGRSEFHVASLEKRGPITLKQKKSLRKSIEDFGRSIKSRPLPVIATTLLGLLACVLSPILITPLQTILLGIIFGLGILFPLGSFLFSRLLGSLLTPAQFVLLAGFGYRHFHWGASVGALNTPLSVIADLEWIFWLLFICEALIVIILTMNEMMG